MNKINLNFGLCIMHDCKFSDEKLCICMKLKLIFFNSELFKILYPEQTEKMKIKEIKIKQYIGFLLSFSFSNFWHFQKWNLLRTLYVFVYWNVKLGGCSLILNK